MVFVAGHLNELIPGYFDDNVVVANELGATTQLVAPPSPGTMDADVFLVTGAAESHHQPGVILFGHVEAVIVVLGAVGGSPIADFLSKVKPPGLSALTTAESERVLSAALTELARTLTPEEWDRLSPESSTSAPPG